MITLAMGAKALGAVRADLRDVVAPAVSDPTAAQTLQMIDFVLAQLEASVDDQGAWMREEIGEIEQLAHRVVAEHPELERVTAALGMLDSGRAPSERLAEVRAEYKLASEVLSVVLEELVARPGPLKDAALAVLEARLVRETEIRGEFVLVGQGG